MASSNNTGNNKELTPSVEETLLNESGSIARVIQIYEVRELYLSGEAAPLVLSCVGLSVELERNVIQLSSLCLPD